MDFLADNGVQIAAIAFGALVLAGLALAALAGLRLWRVLKRVRKRIARVSEALSAEVAQLSDSLARLPERQAELQGSLASLQARAAVLSLLAGHAARAIAVLRSPLRYLGR